MSYRQELRELSWGNYGIITTTMAKDIGVPLVELRKLASRGFLSHRGYGVYRMEESPYEEFTEYAEAVALCGEGSMLIDVTVLSMRQLGLVNPRYIRVAVPRRVRRNLSQVIKPVYKVIPAGDHGTVEGIPTTTLKRALLDSFGMMPSNRLIDAVDDARKEGWLSGGDHEELLRYFEGILGLEKDEKIYSPG